MTALSSDKFHLSEYINFWICINKETLSLPPPPLFFSLLYEVFFAMLSDISEMLDNRSKIYGSVLIKEENERIIWEKHGD